jgi:hypothetical protein
VIAPDAVLRIERPSRYGRIRSVQIITGVVMHLRP